MSMAICGNCFNNIPDQGLCPICGYDNSLDGKIPIALLPGTVLNQRFFVGRVLGQGGFGITYLA
ncbi:MAG: hypothetical protein K6C06_00775, partial [Lachnospiraceae bacterium]|nr:hypothetical protein [Lachnospiraceae bacterium]